LPPFSIVCIKRRNASLALLMTKYLLDSFEPCTRYIFAFSFAVYGDQYDLLLLDSEKVDHPCASAFPFSFGSPPQFAAASRLRDDDACVGMLAKESLQGKKFVIRKQIVSQFGKRR
jgi:hypothetical protein